MDTEHDECDNGELQPDSSQPSGGTLASREDGRRLERHRRKISGLIEQEATTPDSGP